MQGVERLVKRIWKNLFEPSKPVEKRQWSVRADYSVLARVHRIQPVMQALRR